MSEEKLRSIDQRQEMQKAYLQPRTVRDISNLNYFIPDYQRGYRWTTVEVEQLLNDIYSFESKTIESGTDTWYCLQPLVVKKMTSFPLAFNQNQDLDWFEVIDGQQRLTTIFLIIHYINERFRGSKKDAEPTIHYQSRESSSEFLKNIIIGQEDDRSNIDYFHISQAFNKIHDWFEAECSNYDKFIIKLYDQTQVIWYQTYEKDAIEIFTRINTGKIKLTNAELVKALFLNSSNFENSGSLYHKQLQISLDWENIEYTLHDDSFWLFINKEQNDIPTRIEFLLDLIKRKPLGLRDENFTFLEFFNDFQYKSESYIFDQWYAIKKTYLILLEWFNDPILHNKIGFLIYCDLQHYTLQNMLAKYNSDTKSKFESYLNGGITSFLLSIGCDLEKIEYKSNQATLRRILLLHNIETMNQNKSDDSKFPFKKLKDKKNGWDIEHIGSVTEKIPDNDAHKNAWINDAINHIKDANLMKRCQNWKADIFQELFHDVVEYFNGPNSKTDDTTNMLGNLALLDSKTNRGYKNAVFPEKRSKIIEKDRSGQFIPICTKNLFMKYYSTNVEHNHFWTEQDRAEYLKNIVETLSVYYNEQ
ncbi:DUF262 domain-containing protein [Flavobacterium selenitireducens]|uniref:DUF262 domain-containing protein n=1 Tax=Flavobacterium selenitireducens TaxID=2722704 RepID=UPI00168B0604|nr:DUF262 domain-containing protein [Flavobacterium selenitireducens]MBD3583500.1 DUF262 domain-containing protein [Flavobacterium selenitireducens]